MRKILLVLVVFFIQLQAQRKTESLRLAKYKIAVLSDRLAENSGLDFFSGRLFTFNDSGNSADLFEINPQNGDLQVIYKTNLQNKDWEALANDGQHFYIGDFGNNAGTRKDLTIYKLPFVNDSLKMDSLKSIRFFYPEQKDFRPRNISQNFDAESMIFLKNQLHVFTKEWATNTISHYLINPESTADQPAEKLETYDLGFVATDVAYYSEKLYVVGYTKKAGVFLSVFQEDENGFFFAKPTKKYALGSAPRIGQVEGIAANEKGLYFSSEHFNFKIFDVPQSLYFVPWEKVNAAP